jgi:hypothetical protein
MMQAKEQWIFVPSQSKVDNMNPVRRDASRYFRNKGKAYMRAKVGELENKTKYKNLRAFYNGISDFKKGYQPRNNIVKDEKLIWLQIPTEFWLVGGTISPSS